MRNLTVVLLMLLCVAVAGQADAQRFAGHAQREYRGRTYIYQPISYYAPVWYAGNGIVKTKANSGAPVWPGTQYDKVVR